MTNITFNFADIENQPSINKHYDWLVSTSKLLFSDIYELSYVFCSDDYLLDINKKALNHDYYTDIITFDLRDNETSPLHAEIYISTERVKDNANENSVTFAHELRRVMVHGLLHLTGYNDHTDEEKKIMRAKEEEFINL